MPKNASRRFDAAGFIIVDSLSAFVQNDFMKTMTQSGPGFRCLFLILIGSFIFLMPNPSQAEILEQIHEALPEKIDGWTAEPEDHVYNEKTIFQYIDGAAEVYKAYRMKQCLSRRYVVEDGPGIVLDIFDMRTSADAFGVFTHDTDGEPVQIGQAALYRPGWLSFWKQRFFVSIYAEEETAAAKKAILALGEKIAALIKTEGAKPDIVSRLPLEGLQTGKIRYLHHPIILNYHFYLSDENILNLSDRTDAVLANYKQGDEFALLLLVVYPDDQTAAASLKRFMQSYLHDAGNTGITLLENKKWAAGVAQGSLLAVVLEADSRQITENLLKAVK